MIAMDMRIVGDISFIAQWDSDGAGRAVLFRDLVDDITDIVHDLAQQFAPEDSGELRTLGIGVDEVDKIPPGNRYRGIVGLRRTPRHGEWVHEGTGIFGPTGSPIRSPLGNVMRFQGREGWVSKNEVLGQPAQPFLRQAFEVANATRVPVRIRRFAAELR